MKKNDIEWKKRLKLGNDKEDLLVGTLNLNGIAARLNNVENNKDVDIELFEDELYVDSKYIETVFLWSKQFTGIEPENCLPLNKTHIESYDKKEKQSGKKVWIAFLVDFKQFGIYEYRFFPNSYFVHQLNHGLVAKDNKINVDRTKGYTFDVFKKYIGDLRKIRNK
ncbi:hypothetical protein D3C87_75990 [compost metagenome]